MLNESMFDSQNICPLELKIAWEIVNKAINVETRQLKKISKTFNEDVISALTGDSNIKSIIELEFDMPDKPVLNEVKSQRIEEIIKSLNILKQKKSDIRREVDRIKSTNEYFFDKDEKLKRFNKKIKIKERISIVESEIKELEERLNLLMQRARVLAFKSFDLNHFLEANSSLKFSENMIVKSLKQSNEIDEKQFIEVKISDSDELKKFIENQKEQLIDLQKESVVNDRETNFINYGIQCRKLYRFALNRDYKFYDESKDISFNYWKDIESEYYNTYKNCCIYTDLTGKFGWFKKSFVDFRDSKTMDLLPEKDLLNIFNGFNLERIIYNRIKVKIKAPVVDMSTDKEYYSILQKILESVRERFLEGTLRKCMEVYNNDGHFNFNVYDYKSSEEFIDKIIDSLSSEMLYSSLVKAEHVEHTLQTPSSTAILDKVKKSYEKIDSQQNENASISSNNHGNELYKEDGKNKVANELGEKSESEELANAHRIIIEQRNKNIQLKNKIKSLERGFTKSELEKIIDSHHCRKKNGKINYSALGKQIGYSNHTAKSLCDHFNIS